MAAGGGARTIFVVALRDDEEPEPRGQSQRGDRETFDLTTGATGGLGD